MHDAADAAKAATICWNGPDKGDPGTHPRDHGGPIAAGLAFPDAATYRSSPRTIGERKQSGPTIDPEIGGIDPPATPRTPANRKVGVAARMQRSAPAQRLKVVDLNPHLSCILCGGYFIDATTITECLHSFCRACIVRYLETSQYCPVCEVMVHKSRPLRSDKMLQDIVYKLVPGLFHNEMKRRRELYASQPPEALKESRDAEDRGECLDERFIYAPDEIFSLSIEYGKEADSNDVEEDDNSPKRRFLRCPAAVTVSHLKKFIRMKYGIPASYEVDLRFDKESLSDEYTLMDVAYIFQWNRKGPLQFLYKIVDKPKRAHPEPVLVNNHSEPELLKAEPPPPPPAKDEAEPAREPAQTIPPTPEPQAPPTPKEETKPTSAVTPTVAPPAVVAVPSVQIAEPVKTKAAEAETRAAPVCSVSVAPLVESKVVVVQQQAPAVVRVETKEDARKEASREEKKETVSLTFRFSPGGGLKSPTDVPRPTVMTVAPMTKPSPSPLHATHGQYTGISIKKSPPNTLPPFKISSHLLPPRVPPLKLSPPRFSRLETCLREQASSSTKKSSSSSKKSSKSSRDKLEQKVAQLKSASSVRSVAPLVIPVPPELKAERKLLHPAAGPPVHRAPPEDHGRKEDPQLPPLPPVKVVVPIKSPSVKESPVTPSTPRGPSFPSDNTKGSSSDSDDKMDLDGDLYEGRLVIAEPPDLPADSDNSKSNHDLPLKATSTTIPSTTNNGHHNHKAVDSEDEEIDVLNDVDVDSGRGSDVSRRSLCGDDDLGSPDPDPRTPPLPGGVAFAAPPKTNGAAPLVNGHAAADCGGALDLSTCGRKRPHDGDGAAPHRAKQVANPAVLDRTRQTATPCVSPGAAATPFKPLSALGKHGGAFKCRGGTLTVINPDPNGDRPKLVIRNLGPRPDRFHHHHHHHHQRM